MRGLLRDGLFSLSLATAVGMTVLAFSLIDVAAAPPHRLENSLVRSPRTHFRYGHESVDFARFKTIHLRTLEVPPDASVGGPGRGGRFGESFVLDDKEGAALQSAFSDTMRDILGRAGYKFVDTPGADTLIVSPVVVKIRLNAPNGNTRQSYSGRGRTDDRGAGSITIAADLADGANGEVIAQVDDHSFPSNMWRENNRVTNLADARLAFAEWARALRDKLRG